MSVLAKKFTEILISAVPSKSAEEFSNLLLSFAHILEQEKNFSLILNSPLVPKDDKIEMLNKILKASNKNIPAIFLNLLTLLIKNGHIKILSLIAKMFEQELQKSKGLTKASITFAEKPSAQQLTSLTKLLENKFNIKPIITINIDESIIGGFIAFFDGKRWDASLKNSFNNLTTKLNTTITLY